MPIAIIIQARMTSTRLPGKVLMDVCGRSLLAYQLLRLAPLKQAFPDLRIVVATTTNATDDPVVALCQTLGVDTYRGSEADVLARYYEAACAVHGDPVLRLTADCPLIDAAVVRRVIDTYYASGHTYVSNALQRTYPRGLDTEIFSFQALETAYQQAHAPDEREHVTPYLYRHPEQFSVGHVVSDQPAMARHRWTVDTAEDFELIRRILTHFAESSDENALLFSHQDVLALLEQHPDWVRLNAHIEQVKLADDATFVREGK
jgi:spore coat polysaccharide biosynthesis protein SpsF